MGTVEALTEGALGVNVETFNSLQLAGYNKSGEDLGFAVMVRVHSVGWAASLYLSGLSPIVAFHHDPSNYSRI